MPSDKMLVSHDEKGAPFAVIPIAEWRNFERKAAKLDALLASATKLSKDAWNRADRRVDLDDLDAAIQEAERIPS